MESRKINRIILEDILFCCRDSLRGRAGFPLANGALDDEDTVKNLLTRQEENRQSLINAFNAIGYNVK